MVMVVEAALVLTTEEAPVPDQFTKQYPPLGVADILTEALQAWDEVPEGEVVPLLSLLTVSE